MEVPVAVSRNTPSSMGQQVHDLDIRVSLMEDRYKRIDAKLDKLLDGISGQGAPPTPKSRARTKDDDSEDAPAKRGAWGILPGTGKEVAIALSALVATASSLMASYYAFQSGNAAYDGAQQAVEDAVEQAEAVPVAAPVVVPIPHPVPMPVPPPPVAEPEPVMRPDDLLDQAVQ
jgi:hypothetical protein